MLALPQAFFRLLAFRDVHIHTKDTADLAALLKRADDVVVCPGLPADLRFHFPLHPFASKSSAVVIEPQFATVFVGGTVPGLLADDIPGDLPGNSIL